MTADILVDTNPALAEKLRRATPHWMRHTHATHALQRGAELTTVRDNLRNASLSTTSMYLHSDDLRRAKQIGGAFEAPAARTAGAGSSGSISTESTKVQERAVFQVVVAVGVFLSQRVNLPEKYDYPQIQEGSSGLWVFPLAVGLAFLILAAAYGSWSLPLAVLAIVPTVILGALGGVWLAGGDNNLFTQVGLVVLVGLATKNAILIVEFARRQQKEGASAVDAVVEAARLRLRPILMTSLAFVMGVLPLVFASGAGAEMRHAVGVAVFAGMLVVTVAGLLFTPVFYVLLQRRRANRAAALAAAQ